MWWRQGRRSDNVEDRRGDGGGGGFGFPLVAEAARAAWARDYSGCHVDSACGAAQAAMGPFYCPGDRKVYIDLSFYNDMKKQARCPWRLCLGLCDRP